MDKQQIDCATRASPFAGNSCKACGEGQRNQLDRLNLKLPSLRIKKVEIESKLAANPGNCTLRRERQEVFDNIGKTQIKLMDEVDIELTSNERTAHD